MKRIILVILVFFGIIGHVSACETLYGARATSPSNGNENSQNGGSNTTTEDCIPTVTITGDRPRDSSGFIGLFTSNVQFAPSPSGGGSGNGDDGSKGKGQVPGRQPGCLRESLFIAETLGKIAATGAPVGTFLNIQLGDKRYDDGNWQKWQAGVIITTSSAPFATVVKSTITMHYLYNSDTGEISQVKLKNSYEAGCVGIAQPNGSA